MEISNSVSITGSDNVLCISEKIDQIKNLVLSCLQQYMCKVDVIKALQRKGIPSCLINIVLNRLQNENEEFFAVYKMSLELIVQIKAFNKMLERQYRLMIDQAIQDSDPIASNNCMTQHISDLGSLNANSCQPKFFNFNNQEETSGNGTEQPRMALPLLQEGNNEEGTNEFGAEQAGAVLPPPEQNQVYTAEQVPTAEHHPQHAASTLLDLDGIIASLLSNQHSCNNEDGTNEIGAEQAGAVLPPPEQSQVSTAEQMPTAELHPQHAASTLLDLDGIIASLLSDRHSCHNEEGTNDIGAEQAGAVLPPPEQSQVSAAEQVPTAELHSQHAASTLLDLDGIIASLLSHQHSFKLNDMQSAFHMFSDVDMTYENWKLMDQMRISQSGTSSTFASNNLEMMLMEEPVIKSPPVLKHGFGDQENKSSSEMP